MITMRQMLKTLGVCAALLSPSNLLSAEQVGRWEVLSPDHTLWDDGLEGAALVLDDDSYAMMLLRPDGQDALISIAYPGTPGQSQLKSSLEMPDGTVRQLTVNGDNLISLPSPYDGFAAYAFILDKVDFELVQAGLRWRLTTATEQVVFPLKGSRIAIEKALALRTVDNAADS